VAAASAGLVPLPGLRGAASAALAIVAAACLAAVAARAPSPGALGAAVLLLAVVAESARRRSGGPRARG
jgi:hypothetical protein